MLPVRSVKKPRESFLPEEVVHPGCYIYQTYVLPKNLTIAQAAKKLHISADAAERLFKGERGLWNGTAKKAEALGWSTASELIKMQCLFSLYTRNTI